MRRTVGKSVRKKDRCKDWCCLCFTWNIEGGFERMFHVEHSVANSFCDRRVGRKNVGLCEIRSCFLVWCLSG